MNDGHEIPFTFVWEIKDIRTLCKNETRVDSGPFRIKDIDSLFFLYIEPSFSRQTVVFLNSLRKLDNLQIHFKSSVIDVSSTEIVQSKGCVAYRGGFGEAIKITSKVTHMIIRIDQLLPQDTFTLRFVVEKVTKQEKTREDKPKDTLARAFEELWKQQKDTDVVLRVRTKEIAAHKLVLKSRSPVFTSMLDHDMVEKTTNQVSIEDVDYDVMVDLVQFLYTDDMIFRDLTHTLKLLAAADKYDVFLLRSRCVANLAKNISEDNVFQVLSVAHVYHEDELLQCCKIVIYSMSSMQCLAMLASQQMLCAELTEAIEFLTRDQESKTTKRKRRLSWNADCHGRPKIGD